MKKFLIWVLLCSALIFSGCTSIDELTERLDVIEDRLDAFQKVLDAYENNLFITSVYEIDGGYSISFSDGSSVVIYNGKDGADGAPGKEGKPGSDGDTFFQNVMQDDEYVHFVLADGTVISIPKIMPLSIQFNTEDLIVMPANSSRNIRYEVTSALPEVQIETVSSGDIRAKVIPDSDNSLTGVITVQVGDRIDEYSKVVVLVSNGRNVIMKTLIFEEEMIAVVDDAQVVCASEGGIVELIYLSNVECEVVIPENAKDWLSVLPSTKEIKERSIPLQLAPNPGATRETTVTVQNKDASMKLEYKVVQNPDADYQLQMEREALIAFYNALGGDNWYNNENWCSDKPLDEWYGINTSLGNVIEISLSGNNLSGELPKEIKNLVRLNTLYLEANMALEGAIPDEIIHLKDLRELRINSTGITEISDNIFELSNLKTLEASGSEVQFEVTDKIVCLEKLETLNVDLASNSVISPAIGNCFSLKSLHLSGDGTQCIPEEVYLCSNLERLYLNDLKGTISEGVGDLERLEYIRFSGTNITGEIPQSICNLRLVRQLTITNTSVTGHIPDGLFSVFDPRKTDESGGHIDNRLDLSHNNLYGNIPVSITEFMDRFQKDEKIELKLTYNRLSGLVPEEVQNNPNWYKLWPYIIPYNHLEQDGLYLPGPWLTGCDIDGVEIDSSVDYAKCDYTVLWCIPLELATNENYLWNLYEIRSLYEKYKDDGIQIWYMGAEWNTESELRSFRQNNDIPWRIFNVAWGASRRLIINGGDSSGFLPISLGNQVNVIDKNGVLVYSGLFDGESYEQLDNFFDKHFSDVSGSFYNSTDYSEDGKVKMLHRATKGNGVNIVLMGDGYSDRLIADGTYGEDMQKMADAFFEEEPYKSFKEYFNVYSVNVVSKNEVYDKYSSTALEGWFGNGTEVGGNGNTVFTYAQEALSAEEMNEAMIIVAMNSDAYAGTCYVYNPVYTSRDCGTGVSIAYFSKGSDKETFAQLLHHEACGHGFAKLADEYAYEEYGAVPSSYVTEVRTQQDDWGWWKNVDFTSDQSQVRWSRFLEDERYQYDGLGCFEGGLTYWSGVWRPTENSIMRYNTGGFNAPSREAIWYRIHKLAYGDSWEYDYEDFVEYDAANRASSSSAAAARRQRMNYVERTFEPTAPPVIVNKSWRDIL